MPLPYALCTHESHVWHLDLSLFQGSEFLCLTAFFDSPTYLTPKHLAGWKFKQFKYPLTVGSFHINTPATSSLIEGCSKQLPRSPAGLNPGSRTLSTLQHTLYWLSSFPCLPPSPSQDHPPNKPLAHKSFPRLVLCTKALYRCDFHSLQHLCEVCVIVLCHRYGN